MKTRTKTSAIWLLSGAVALSMFCGCGGGNNSSTMQSDSLTTASSLIETVESTTEPPKEYAITNATVFSDGYAWVYLEDVNMHNYKEHENRQTACINKSGEIQFFLNLEHFNYQDQSFLWNNYQLDYNFWHSTDANFWEWHEGTSLVHSTSGPQRIYDTKGNLIFETDDTYYKVACYADGYYAVMKQVKSIDKNEHFVCFLNTDGTWQKNEWNLNTDSDYYDVDYRGEGIFYCSAYKGKYYNINSNREFEVNTTEIIDSPAGNFSNGKILYKSPTRVIDSNGSIINKYENTQTTGFNGQYAAIFDAMYAENPFIKCYDSQNDKITDIATFTNGIEIPYKEYMFDGDKICIELKGIDKNHYFTTYTSTGKQLYDPIQCDENKMWSLCDRILITRDGKYYVYDYNGNLIFDEEKVPYQNPDFHQYSDDVMLINYSGNNFQYIDKDGKILFEKLSYNNVEYNIVKS